MAGVGGSYDGQKQGTRHHGYSTIQPQYLALITGSGFAKVNRRRMTQWKRQFDLDGDVFVIEDYLVEKVLKT